jgi:hypothetical protein
MVAPAGVNKELPQESTAAEPTPAELAEPQSPPQSPAPEPAGPAETAAEALAADPSEAEATATDPGEARAAATEPGETEPAEGDDPNWEAEEGSRDVHPLAVVGIIFGVIALVAVAAGVLALATHGFRPKTVVIYRPAAAFGLRPGQCVNSGTNALSVTVLSCTRPHDAEVFAAFSLPATAWPGASAVQRDAGNGCGSRLDGYLNPQLATAALTQEYIYPNQAAWQAGEHTVVCEVRAVSGQLTGSVRAKA